MSKKKKIIIAGVVVAIVVVVGGLIAMNSLKATSVDVATAGPAELAQTVSGSGTVVAEDKENAQLPSTGGTIISLKVKDGDEVTEGQVIAKIDTDPYEAQLKQAKAGLAQAQAGVKSAQGGVTQINEGVSQAQSALNKANKAYSQTKKAVSAAKKAAKAGVPGAAAQLTAAEKANAEAQAGVAQAKSALKSAQSKGAKSSATAGVSSAKSAVSSAQSAVKVAQDDLAKCTVKAPMNGTIFFNAIGTPGADGMYPVAAKGSVVSAAAPPFTVVDPDTLVFEVAVDEADIISVSKGMTATVNLDSFNGTTFDAKVTSVAKKATTTATGGTVFPAQLELTLGEGETLLSGMKGDATIESSVTNAAVAIPIDALFEDNGESYVFVVSDGKAVKTTVTSGVMTDTHVEITDGLTGGETVAIPGSVTLTDGMRVDAKNSDSTSATE